MSRDQVAAEAVRLRVWSGFYDADEIREVVVEDMFEDQIDADWVEEQIAAEFAKKETAEAEWESPTDFERLNDVFDQLDAEGILTSHNAGLTQSEGLQEVGELKESMEEATGLRFHGYCFYHWQDVEDALLRNRLHLSFGSFEGGREEAAAVAERIKRQLESEGFTVAWNGSADQRLAVSPFEWKQRAQDEDEDDLDDVDDDDEDEYGWNRYRRNFPRDADVPAEWQALHQFDGSTSDWYAGDFRITFRPFGEGHYFDKDSPHARQIAIIGRYPTGSYFAHWLIEGLSLSESPIIYLDSEGSGDGVLAQNPREFLSLLALGEGWMPEALKKGELKGPDPGATDRDKFLAWLREEFGIEPAQDPFGIPQRARQKFPGFEAWRNKYWEQRESGKWEE